MSAIVAPSLLSADFLHLEDDVKFVNEYADIFHLDVMDGSFVPNISFGFPVINAISKCAEKPMDIHLMIENPGKYLEEFAATGAKMISFHIEAAQEAGTDPAELLRKLRLLGVRPGIAADPDVPVEELFPYLGEASFVLIMTVFAGFGGQKFIEDSIARIQKVKEEIRSHGYDCQIEIDGGVTTKNAARIHAAGADIIVAGSAVFKAEDRVAAVSAIRG